MLNAQMRRARSELGLSYAIVSEQFGCVALVTPLKFMSLFGVAVLSDEIHSHLYSRQRSVFKGISQCTHHGSGRFARHRSRYFDFLVKSLGFRERDIPRSIF